MGCGCRCRSSGHATCQRVRSRGDRAGVRHRGLGAPDRRFGGQNLPSDGRWCCPSRAMNDVTNPFGFARSREPHAWPSVGGSGVRDHPLADVPMAASDDQARMTPGVVRGVRAGYGLPRPVSLPTLRRSDAPTLRRSDASVANGACRLVVRESDPGKGFDRGQGAWALGRHDGSTPIGIGVHDGAAARGLAVGPVADTGDRWHRWRPRGVGNLPREDRRALVRKDRDARIASATGVLTDDPTARRWGLDRTAVGASERGIGLSQGWAG